MKSNYFSKNSFEPKIKILPNKNLGITVVIPSYNEPDLRKSLESILKCKQPNCSVEVITVINYPENSSTEVIENAEVCVEIVEKVDRLSDTSNLKFYSIYAPNLPKKQAGVGLARKIGMDEAAWRFFNANHPKGIIACYDADSDCMPNYLVELEKLWQIHPKTNACSIRYEHPIDGRDFDSKIYNGIAQYELHLRYYNQASRLIKFPFAFHTIGSSMACCAESYVKFGGMNRHQAGEDFYFLQKIIPHGNFRELNSTCVYPSPRPSYRVPFGTGRAMIKYQESDDDSIYTYNFDVWSTLTSLFDNIELIYNSDTQGIETLINGLHPVLRQFISSTNYTSKINEIKANTTSLESFRKRFFFWFDAFMLLKYLNFAHESYFQRKPIEGEAKLLAKEIGIVLPQNANCIDLLNAFRKKENQPLQ